ncbi:MAG: TlpA disulfide reductase family protein [Acidobacteriota bacterium]
MRKSLLSFFVVILTINSFAQSRRVVPPQALKATDPVPASINRPLKEMFEEANGYAKARAAEYEQKKVVYTDSLYKQIRLEQKQMAAKYAVLAKQGRDLGGEDLYYLGMLHWVAENLDGATDSLGKFIASEDPSPDKVQTARSVIVIIRAKQKDYAGAESLLAEYLKAPQIKLSEQARMEAELGKAYIAARAPTKAAPHADAAFRAMRTIFADTATRPRVADELLDDGMLRFEAYRDSGEQNKADAALDDLRIAGAEIGATPLYYYAVDSLIKYMIDTGRKPLALDMYSLSLERANKDFTSKELQTDVVQRLKKREKHYKMLGEPAPELEKVEQWFPGQKTTLAEMRGKVIFLDFWAAWCAPCIEAFPSIKELQQDFGQDGLAILGVTRYYGYAEGFPVDNPNEIEYLKRFKKTYALPYDLVITKDNTTQRDFGAASLPTAVLIDRKGIVRFVESGTSPNRLEDLRENILKLLAEK